MRQFVFGRPGKPIFVIYAAMTLFTFAFVDLYAAMTVMSLTNVLLLIINSYGIFRLRNEISYDIRRQAKNLSYTNRNK